MFPISEFKFDKINSSMGSEFITAHNLIYSGIKNLCLLSKKKASIDILNEFLSKFKEIDPTKLNEANKSVLLSKKELIDELYSRFNCLQSTDEVYEVNSLITTPTYKKLFEEKIRLEGLTIRSKGNSEKLKSLQSLFVSTITFKEVVSTIVNYKEFRPLILKYYTSINLKVCLYCLAQYTSIYSSKSKKIYLKGNLDHIYPKDKYPLLAVSINNLIPVCSHCNQRKSNTDFKYNPFNQDHIHSFNFNKCIEIKSGEATLTSLKNLEITADKDKSIVLATKLDLKKLYECFEENAQIMVERYNKYHSQGYSNSISKIPGIRNESLLLEYFVSEIPLSDENVLKHPLTKFKIDLYNTIRTKSSN